MKTILRQYLVAISLMMANFTFASTHTAGIDLSGIWRVALDSLDVGEAERWFEANEFPTKIQLPGTTDDARLGAFSTLKPMLTVPQLSRLTRKHSYIGAAWYMKEFEVPQEMAGQPLRIMFERVLWKSDVWIDGRRLQGSGESLTTPHCFELPEGLPTGAHCVTLRVDNRKQYDISVNELAHAYTEDTQIKWNGVLGRMEISVIPAVEFEDIAVYPDVENCSARIVATVVNRTGKTVSDQLTIQLSDGAKKSIPVRIAVGESSIETVYSFEKKPRLWSAYNPFLYELELQLSRSQVISKPVMFGMRNISNEGGVLRLNGHRIFLRGTLECCIHPLTGTPPMTRQGWEKVFSTAREWGLNHLRFHSWCPPEAAFSVADSMGFYLQIELPVWSVRLGDDDAVKGFMLREFERIVRTYGNHPSFCLMTAGNELQYDFEWLNKLVTQMRARDARRLYATTSFTFEKGHGGLPEPQDEFFVTQCTDDGWVRGQGLFDDTFPRFDQNYTDALRRVHVPLIAHEIGQYAVYPNLREIEKYTGVLDPINFKAIRNDLDSKELLDRADDYTMATGRFAALLYKEEVERALKTERFSGFQLLGLQDFSGQGTATVGLVDAFWDSKGVVEPSWFRAFCADVVPLAHFEKATYTNAETFKATFEIANYSFHSLDSVAFRWQLYSADTCYASGRLPAVLVAEGGLASVGNVMLPLSQVKEAKQLTLQLSIEGTEWKNCWQIWVYPFAEKPEPADVAVTHDVEEALLLLADGQKVLLCPQPNEIKGIKSKFVPVFWSPVHFPAQAGGMGILCNPSHPALELFPTETHSNWQWWSLVKHAKTMLLDAIPQIMPIVSVIDNFANNRRLGLVFEANCGNGKLVVCSIDLTQDTPETQQLRASLLNYMASDKFLPAGCVSPEEVRQALCHQ